MVYRFAKDRLCGVVLHQSTAGHMQGPSLPQTVIYSPSSKSHASRKNSWIYTSLLFEQAHRCYTA